MFSLASAFWLFSPFSRLLMIFFVRFVRNRCINAPSKVCHQGVSVPVYAYHTPNEVLYYHNFFRNYDTSTWYLILY